jgi:hypothetical protein
MVPDLSKGFSTCIFKGRILNSSHIFVLLQGALEYFSILQIIKGFS